MEIYEIKALKAETDAGIFDLINKFETKSGLEVMAVYFDRQDVTELSGPRKTQLISVDIQAVLEPIIQKSEGPE